MKLDDDTRREDTYVGPLPQAPEFRFATDELPALVVPQLIVFRANRDGQVGSGQPYAVHGKVVIGRGEDADIMLPAADVSRRHAEVSATQEGDFVVTDLGSANGTFVNNQQVKQAVLKPGDRITIGTSFALLFTRYHPLETQLMQAQKLESLGQLAAGIVHEINNPLAFVYYNLESLTRAMSKVGAVMADTLSSMLKVRERLGTMADAEGLLTLVEETADPEALEAAAACLIDAKDGVRRILNIIGDLKTFSRTEEDKLAAVDVNNVLEIAAKIAHGEIKLRASLVKDCCPAPMTRAHEGRLAQVFLNLLLNAVQAFEGGGPETNTITLRTRTDGEQVVVEVHDNGRGIAPEIVDRVFEPFFTTKEGGLGSGLGLSICHSIVCSHGGTIEVTSVAGEGTCFIVRLPRLKAGTGAHITAEHLPLRRRHGPAPSARILVIDDEAFLRTAIKRALPNHYLEAVGSGAEAERLLMNDRSFDLILCDLLMPRYTGMDLHRWIARECPELLDRLVFMSGGACTPESIAFTRSTPVRLLDKPIGMDMLEEVISEMAGRRGA